MRMGPSLRRPTIFVRSHEDGGPAKTWPTLRRLSGPTQTNVTVTPGFRTELGSHWYFLGGLDIPLAAPKPYREQLIFWMMKTW